MRALRVVVLSCIAATAAAQPAPAPAALDAALAAASANGKPLVIEFAAQTCVPCRAFDKLIVPRADVAAALARVALVRYDLDTPDGQLVAQRYNVTGVPAFVAVAGRDGVELERSTGMVTPRAFIALLGRVAEAAPRMLELARAVERDPHDFGARLKLADFERAAGRDVDALVMYRDILTAPDVDALALARARRAIERLEAGFVLQRGLDSDAVAVAHAPGTPAATAQLARLAVARRLAAPQLRELAIAHLAHLGTTNYDDIADALRAAVLAGASAEATRALNALPHDVDALRIAAADLAMYRGDWVAARGEVARVCTTPHAGYELRCYARRIALSGAEHVLLPGIGHLAAATSTALHGLTPDANTDFEALGDLDPAFARAVAGDLLEAAAACATFASASAIVSIAITPRAAGGGPAVQVTTRDTPLGNCVRAQIEDHVLPPAPAEVATLTLPLDIAFVPLPIVTAEPPPRPIDANVVAFASFRTGTVETRGVGAQGLVDLARLDRVRLVGIAQGEVGAAGSDASFAAHAMIGAGYASRLLGTWSLSGGVGASSYGDMAPAALAFPIQLRLGFTLFGVHCALWGQSVVFPMEPRRQLQRLGGDEVSAGFSAAIPRTHVFVGATVEDRSVGRAGVVMVGVPLVFGP